MEEEEARFLQRKVKAGRIDVHPTEMALVVFYEVEATILADTGESMMGDRKECQKRIRVPTLSSSTNIAALAEQIVQRCRLIHPSKQPDVEQLLRYLQERQTSAEHRRVLKQEAARKGKRSLMEEDAGAERATIGELDTYLERLYDELPDKIKGTGLILQLARNPDNLEELVLNETLMSALARVLREEGLKSMELVTNIISIFFFFSSFSQFHEIVSQYKIGATCMKVIDQEIKRNGIWAEHMEKRQRRYRAKKMTKEEFESAIRKFTEQVFRQDTLLYVAFHLLLNLAEDTRVEVKMRNKNIVRTLVTMLDRENEELLLLIVTFLKKLSIFVENKREMAEEDIVAKLHRLIPSESENLTVYTCSLLLNLSFDPSMCARIAEMGLVPKLVALLEQFPETAAHPAVVCLYNVSRDPRHKGVFGFTDIVPLVMGMILKSQSELVDIELVGLAINLATDERCAEAMCTGSGLKLLMKRGLKNQDSLLLKMIRNLAEHDSVKQQFLPFVDSLATVMVSQGVSDDSLVEIVGIVANLNVEGVDYEKLIVEFNLLDFVNEILQPDAAEDDLVLEVVILVGTILASERCAARVGRAGIVDKLVLLLKERQEDDEIVLQIVYVFNKLVFHEATRGMLISHAQAVGYVIDLMHDKNPIIRNTCDSTLDIVMEHDDEWASEIRMKKFRFHNSQWIEMALDGQGASDDFFYEDEEQPDFLNDSFDNAREASRLDFSDDGDYMDDELDDEDIIAPEAIPVPNASEPHGGDWWG